MASAATKRELDKVKLGKKRQNKSGKRDEPDSASDTESDQTDIGEDEPEYFPGKSLPRLWRLPAMY